ncbi:MAG: hypothetical protein M5U19_22505, partial [Microthrixaceae bacterium]|nr:hypothetical protein [Microthrixaceae bacterium]
AHDGCRQSRRGGFAYPGPGHLEQLADAVGTLESGPVRRNMERFTAAVGELELGSGRSSTPPHVTCRPSSSPTSVMSCGVRTTRRGEFMADLKVDMEAHGVELRGELPDHIEVVLRYIDALAATVPSHART